MKETNNEEIAMSRNYSAVEAYLRTCRLEDYWARKLEAGGAIIDMDGDPTDIDWGDPPIDAELQIYKMRHNM
tara:strand:+ start:289 stop:504 length:216 start_codon:yes stop_codon:yes gene_type:complete